MKKLVFIAFSALALNAVAGCGRPNITSEVKIQQDYDHLRLEHLEYWTGLIEEFHKKTGYYPLQKTSGETAPFTHVQILPPDSNDHLIDWGDNFLELTSDALISELESGLGRKVKFKFPPETTPPDYAYAYNYFVESDGYLVWVTCQSCGITKISTYTMDGKSATVNIASAGMVPKVTKAQTRENMLAHPRYKIWRSIDVHDKNRMRKLKRRYK